MAERDVAFAIRFRDRATSAFRNVRRAIDRTAATTRDASRRMREFADAQDTTKNRLQDLATAVGGGLLARRAVQLNRDLVQQFANVEEELIAVGKTTDLTDVQLASLNARFEELTESTPLVGKSLRDAGRIAGNLGVTGVNNIAKFSETVGKLVVSVEDLGAEQASFALSRILNLTGDEIGNVDRLASQFVALGNSLEATEGQIANMSLELSQSLGPLGVTSTEVVGLSGALSAMGQRAERTRTSLQQFFTAVAIAAEDGGEGLAEFAALTGRTEEQFQALFADQGLFATAVEALRGMSRELSGAANPAAAMNRILEDLGINSERATQVLVALASRMDDFDKSMGIVNAELENTNALEKEFARFSESLNAAFQQATSSAENLGRELGENLAPVVAVMVEGFAKGAQALGDFIDRNEELSRVLVPAVAAISILAPAILAIAASGQILLQVLSKALGGFTKLSALVGGLARTIPFLGAVFAATSFATRTLGQDTGTLSEEMLRTSESAQDLVDSLEDLGSIARAGPADAMRRELQDIDAQLQRLRDGLGFTPEDSPFRSVIQGEIQGLMAQRGQILAQLFAFDDGEVQREATKAATKASEEFQKAMRDIELQIELVGLSEVEKEVRQFRAKLEEEAREDDSNLTSAEIGILVDRKRFAAELEARDELRTKVEEQIEALRTEREFIDASEATRRAAVDTAKLMAEARKQLGDLTGEEAEQLRELIEVQLREELILTAQAEKRHEVVDSIEEQIDALKEEQQLVGLTRRERELLEPVLRAESEARREGVTRIDEYLNALRREAEQTQQLREAASQGAEGFRNGLAQSFEDFELQARDTSRIAQDLFTTATGGMTDSLVQLFKTGKTGWKDFANAIIDQILRVIAQLLVLRAVQAATSFGTVTGGSETVNLGTQGAPVGSTSGLNVAPRGAYVKRSNKGTLALVGTEGDELVIPTKHLEDDRNASSLDAYFGSRRGGGGGGRGVVVNSTVNMTVNQGGQVSRDQQQGNDKMAAEVRIAVERAVERKVVEMQRPGGTLNPTETQR